MASPLEQFRIEPLIPLKFGEIDISFTNSALWMIIAVIGISLIFARGIKSRALVPGRLQAATEMCYDFIASMLRDTVGPEGKRYFPFVFTLFLLILVGNLLGMIPYSFTYTSHIIVTFTLAIVVMALVTLLGIIRHGFKFFSYFVPQGVPKVILPLLVPIEILSYLSRPVSLSVRLFANMMAGHTMLKVFAGFTIVLGYLGGWAPLAVNIALTGFEFVVAILQAYVFTILTCLYLHDAIHLHA